MPEIQAAGSPVLLIAVDGAFKVGPDARARPIDAAAFARALANARAIVVEGDISKIALSPRLRIRIDDALSFLPFFSILPDRVSPAHIEWLQKNLTVFDRVLTGKPRAFCHGSFQLITRTDDRGECIARVLADLASDVETTEPEGAPYSPARHWQARGQAEGLVGRAVCYAQAPRIINKSMHAVQVAALKPAIARAARASEDGHSKPNLLDYGCGVGRLASVCQPHATYFGTDIAPSMIGRARALHPDRSFFVVDELQESDLPKFHILLFSTVLHHNDSSRRREILANCERLCSRRARLILLEDFIGPGRNAENMFPLTISGLLDDIAATFGGTCDLSGMRLLGYKPNDYSQRTAILELDLDR